MRDPPRAAPRSLARFGFGLRFLVERIGQPLARAIVIVHLSKRHADIRETFDGLVKPPGSIKTAPTQPQIALFRGAFLRAITPSLCQFGGRAEAVSVGFFLRLAR